MYDGIKYALCYIWNEKKDQKADGHWPQDAECRWTFQCYKNLILKISTNIWNEVRCTDEGALLM